MPRTDALPSFGRDVFVIGGGASLRNFNWSRLEGKDTVGCNQAFLLGPSICRVCCFGDRKFWDHFKDDLEGFGGWVVTNYHDIPGLENLHAPAWLKRFGRIDEGLSDDPDKLAWNYNTGALAVNLALLLGAKRVLLLGVDLGMPFGATHWHRRAIETPDPSVYPRFAKGFLNVAVGLAGGLFAGSCVINVDHGPDCFPTLSYDEVFS